MRTNKEPRTVPRQPNLGHLVVSTFQLPDVEVYGDRQACWMWCMLIRTRTLSPLRRRILDVFSGR